MPHAGRKWHVLAAIAACMPLRRGDGFAEQLALGATKETLHGGTWDAMKLRQVKPGKAQQNDDQTREKKGHGVDKGMSWK